MGGITLGMPGPWAKNFHESSDHYTTKIGGLPDWPISETFIKPELLKCVLCGERLCLLAQIYAPISTPKLNVEERVVYVFGCLMPECGSNPRCWRALRVQKCNVEPLYDNSEGCNPSTNFNVEEKDLGSVNGVSFEENLVCENGVADETYDDLDFDEIAKQLSEISFQAFQSKKQKASLSLKVPKQCMQSKQAVNGVNSSIPVVPCFYIHSQEDRSYGDVVAAANYGVISIEQHNDSSNDHKDEEGWEGETYEYDKALGVDRSFLKFRKRMDAYPEQCYRYSYGGEPLLVKPELKELAPCHLCCSPRQYELQLMPPLLYFIHEAADGLSACLREKWNWMTLLVYTCSSNCCQSLCTDQSGSCCWAVAEEAIVIQEES